MADDVEQILLDLPKASAAVSLSVRELQYAIEHNELVARYRGRKPLIEPAELTRWAKALPTEPRKRSA